MSVIILDGLPILISCHATDSLATMAAIIIGSLILALLPHGCTTLLALYIQLQRREALPCLSERVAREIAMEAILDQSIDTYAR